MEGLNQEEGSSSNSRIADATTDVFLDRRDNTNPLTEPSDAVTGSSMSRTAFSDGNEGNDDEFTAAQNHSYFWSTLRYTRAILALLTSVALDLTGANNKSIVSKIVRIVATAVSYGTIYTSTTGLMMWTIAYLMDHGWYILAVSCSIVLLFLCGILLVFYEWMWLWQERAISFLCNGSDISSNIGYNRLRSVNILDEDDMEDDLTLRGWIKNIIHVLISCSVWSLYCALNVTVDFWITEQYMRARPAYYVIELRLMNCIEAAPILLGAALLLYFAYPSFYRWNFCRHQLPSSATISGTVDTIDVPFSSIDDANNEIYTIGADEDNEVTMGVGMQNLLI